MLAKISQTPRGVRLAALSLTIIASMLAPTRLLLRLVHDVPDVLHFVAFHG